MLREVQSDLGLRSAELDARPRGFVDFLPCVDEDLLDMILRAVRDCEKHVTSLAHTHSEVCS